MQCVTLLVTSLIFCAHEDLCVCFVFVLLALVHRRFGVLIYWSIFFFYFFCLAKEFVCFVFSWHVNTVLFWLLHSWIDSLFFSYPWSHVHGIFWPAQKGSIFPRTHFIMSTVKWGQAVMIPHVHRRVICNLWASTWERWVAVLGWDASFLGVLSFRLSFLQVEILGICAASRGLLYHYFMSLVHARSCLNSCVVEDLCDVCGGAIDSIERKEAIQFTIIVTAWISGSSILDCFDWIK